MHIARTLALLLSSAAFVLALTVASPDQTKRTETVAEGVAGAGTIIKGALKSEDSADYALP